MKILVLILILLLLINIYFLITNINYEDQIDFYVITLRNIDRMNNISNQKKLFNIDIKISDAINGITINLDDYVNKGLLDKNFIIEKDTKRLKEIGCYLSHINLLKYINNTCAKKYSVIFEDDFIITSNTKYDFDKIMNNLIYNLSNLSNLLNLLNNDFDIVFLGNTFNNKGCKIVDNIYCIDFDKTIVGLFGYLINNKNINKIINELQYINKPLDIALQELIYKKKIKALIIYPNIISYNEELPSTILNSSLQSNNKI